MRKNIEIFHILFCKNLLTTQDKTLIVLKGGCNLRFFFGSNRYSEDIDFDVETIAVNTLRRRVEKVLESQSFKTMLAARNIDLVSHSAPKQTETVQRWKIMIRCQDILVPTKIEFSRRGIDRSGVGFDPLDALVLTEHNISPMFMSHYNGSHAIVQKIEALAGRSQSQARDIYDLDFLFARNVVPANISNEILDKALECATRFTYDQFYGQVVEFLAPDARDYYSEQKAWDKLQLTVIAKLEGLQ